MWMFSPCAAALEDRRLRVGMAAMKGFAAAINKPIAESPRLKRRLFGPRETELYTLVNAYKGEVYSQLFSFDNKKKFPVIRKTSRSCRTSMMRSIGLPALDEVDLLATPLRRAR